MDKIMREYESLKWSIGNREIIHIVILIATTLVVGLYFISTTVLIAKDGVLYIDIAKTITDNTANVLHDTRQAPGYPFLVYLMHKAIGLFYNAQSLQGWITSAQSVSVISKLIAAIALYFVGCYFVGSRISFWGILILSILPDSVDYGSDALTDWSSIMFLAIGFLFLLLGVQYHKRWLFGSAGIAAGLGYLVRPECGQVVLYGSIWLLFSLVRPQDKMKRTKTAGALFLLLTGFAIVAVPYMKFMGYIFPEQHILKLPVLLSMSANMMNSSVNANIYTAGFSIGWITGGETLMTNICETLVYYFVPALLVGFYYYVRNQLKTLEQMFFATAFIIVNIAMALLQSYYLGFLSRRHTFPLIAFTVIYIPIGMYIIVHWLNGKSTGSSAAAEEKTRRLYFVLIAIGISICAVKLVRMAPLRWEKQGYRDAADWLSKNTTPADIIAVTDKRITFYAERRGLEYEEQIPAQADYVVRMIKSEDEKAGLGKNMKEEYSTRLNKRREKERLVIYKAVH